MPKPAAPKPSRPAAKTSKRVAKADPAQKSQILTEFIAEAMNCTAFGLMVGIPALFAHLFLSNVVKKITDELDMHSVRLENLLINRGKGAVEDSE